MSERRGVLNRAVGSMWGFFQRVTRQRNPEAGANFRRSTAGVSVSNDSLLKTSTCWAACRYVSQTVAGLPWEVRFPMPNNQPGSQTAPMTNPVAWLLGSRANPEMSSFQFRETLTHWALRFGNGYAEIERDAVGRPVALWPLHPLRVDVRRNDDGSLYYRYFQPTGGWIDLAPRNVFHIRGFGDDAVGLSLIEYAAQSIGWVQATELFGSTFFGQGMTPSMIISTTSSLTAPAQAELRKEIESVHRGPGKGSRVAIIDKGMKAEMVSNTAEEAQFIETRQHQIEEICRWFGVPPHKVAHLLRATFSNIEHQSIEVVTDCVYPWCKRFQDEADYKLFGETSRRGYYTTLNLKGLLRGDTAARSAYYQMRRNLGTLSADQLREFEDENPLPDGMGTDYVMQGQYFTLQGIRAQSEMIVRQAEEPPPPPVPPPTPDDDEPDVEDEALLDQAEQHMTQALEGLLA